MDSKTKIGAWTLCVVLASLFWTYVTLSTRVTHLLVVPVVVEPGQKRILEGSLPKDLQVEIHTSGWQILYLKYFSSQPQCNIALDLFGDRIKSDSLILSKSDIYLNLRPSINIDRILRVSPESFSLRTGELITRNIPVLPSASVQLRDGYVLSRGVRVIPDSVAVRGTAGVLSQLRHLPTEALVFTDLDRDFLVSVPLHDTLGGLVVPAVNSVYMAGSVEQIAEQVLHDVPVEYSQAIPPGHRIFPSRITVYLRGPISLISKLDPATVKGIVDYQDILADTVGHVRPRIVGVNQLELVKVQPPTLNHRVMVAPRSSRSFAVQGSLSGRRRVSQ